ncbi:MAG: DUF4760 domain-containing protein [Tsuneonella sp.]
MTTEAMMGKRYRTWDERRRIICSVIADTNPPPVDSFQLTDSELVYFRARSAKAVDALARQSSAFKEYYRLPTQNPFWYVIGLISVVVGMALMGGAYLWLTDRIHPEAYPLIGALVAVVIAALGWGVAGWIAHRNAVQQNTNNMLFARFSQAPFGEAMYRFNTAFGISPTPPVSSSWIKQLRDSDKEEDRRAAAAVAYLLNYFEFIASGVLRGDLDANVVRQNVKAMICHYHDKCLPYISELNRRDRTALEHLIKIRTHFREP